MTMPVQSAIQIRPCESYGDVHHCVDLQRRIWGFADEDLVPGHIFAVAHMSGGLIYLAFDGEAPIGFALAFLAEHQGERYLHSHMVGVLPEYQNQGFGRLIKLRQREDALRSGVKRIEWTFDPLESCNAYFNIARLGAIVRRYIRDCYGDSTSVLHRGLPTDRLVAEWHLDSPRVHAAIAGHPLTCGNDAVAVAVPAKRNSDGQADLRARITGLFTIGHAITGFSRQSGSSAYLLEPYED